MEASLHILFRLLPIAFRRDRRAVTAIEYGLIAALIAIVIVAALHGLGHGESNTFADISKKL
jgi:pilus assembly protein Flp/PilA